MGKFAEGSLGDSLEMSEGNIRLRPGMAQEKSGHPSSSMTMVWLSKLKKILLRVLPMLVKILTIVIHRLSYNLATEPTSSTPSEFPFD